MGKFIKVDTSQMMRGLESFKGAAIRNAATGAQILSAENENRAKNNRKWQDRSGQARSSITGSVETDAQSITIGLAIGADHGIFLEKANGGKYAIIYPTVLETQRKLMDVGRVALTSGGTK